jgi:large conductance mechanosensitive channel
MLKGFRGFLMRGNVVELSVAVVIGSAFTAIVTAFTTGIVKPLINTMGTSRTGQGLGLEVIKGDHSTFLDLGTMINAAINFVILAAVVYFLLVLPMQKIQQRRKRGLSAAPTEPTDVELLIEIRDLLRAQQDQREPR